MVAQPPRPKPPPLSALRAFEAAGRLGGFAPAAAELGVTPAAVTAHLKTLETALGITLFQRQHKGVALTDLGARVLPDFTQAFQALDAALQRLETESAPDLVRIAVPADLAHLWLAPRLPALRAAGWQVVPVIADPPDTARKVADLMLDLRIAPGLPAPLIAVCAPDFVQSTPLDPARTLLLGGAAGDWAAWAMAAGVPGFRPRGPLIALAALALEAAIQGAGVLVIARPLAQAALTSGRLIEASTVAADTGLSVVIAPLRPLSPDSAPAAVLAALNQP